MPHPPVQKSERTFWDFWTDLGTYLQYGGSPPARELTDDELVGIIKNQMESPKLKDFLKTQRLLRKKINR